MLILDPVSVTTRVVPAHHGAADGLEAQLDNAIAEVIGVENRKITG